VCVCEREREREKERERERERGRLMVRQAAITEIVCKVNDALRLQAFLNPVFDRALACAHREARRKHIC
jgi:hypothetical protein